MTESTLFPLCRDRVGHLYYLYLESVDVRVRVPVSSDTTADFSDSEPPVGLRRNGDESYDVRDWSVPTTKTGDGRSVEVILGKV